MSPLKSGVIMNMPNLIQAVLTLAALASALCATQVNAQGQINRHSFTSASQHAFSFEQHARYYADATWTPDNEIEINAKDIFALLKKSKQHKQLSTDQGTAYNIQYKALVSDKSFGIAAQFSF